MPVLRPFPIVEYPLSSTRTNCSLDRGNHQRSHTHDSGLKLTPHHFTPAPLKSVVALSVLEALDIRLGTIVSVEDVEGSRKLMRLRVDFGDHTRAILAGIKRERTDPGAIVGRQALFVVNLEPKRMAGQVSEGLLLDIGYPDGLTPVLAVPERSLPNGARAG